ncbi:MAG: hypothetical protein WC554_02935 [Clostridia bacterium]|jgi:hypothetical protein
MLNVAESTTIGEVINTIELNTGKQIKEIEFNSNSIMRISFYYDKRWEDFNKNFHNDLETDLEII